MENKPTLTQTDTQVRILAEFEKLKGQFVIAEEMKIERLIAIAEDETDYYYVTFDGRRVIYNSCVGYIIPLKGHIKDTDYNKLVHSAKLNHYDQPTLYGNNTSRPNYQEVIDFCNLFKTEIFQSSNMNFLTEICWDL